MIPDKEAIMNEVHDLATEARETPLRAQPDKFASATPIYMGKAHEIVPDKYVMHIAVTLCTGCGAETRESTFFALSYIRSRVNGTRLRHLTRCDRPIFNLPVDRVPTGHHKTPFCAECEIIDLSHLPPPPSASNVYDLAEPTRKGQKVKATKEPVKPTTLDDLI